MKTNETAKPLYQRLNEERTPGEWKYNGVTKIMCDETIIFDEIRCFDGDRIYDAKYAEIAVNNLHHLAEALYEINCICADAKSKDDINVGKIASISIKALNRIS